MLISFGSEFGIGLAGEDVVAIVARLAMGDNVEGRAFGCFLHT